MRSSESAAWGLSRRAKPTEIALRKKTSSQRPVGRPTALTPQLADVLFDGISDGASLAAQLRRYGIQARTFYRWVGNNSEFRHRYQEAVAVRAWLLPERFFGLANEVTNKNCRAKIAEGRMLEKGMAHIEGGRRRWRGS